MVNLLGQAPSPVEALFDPSSDPQATKNAEAANSEVAILAVRRFMFFL
jgi:hypothetical protein